MKKLLMVAVLAAFSLAACDQQVQGIPSVPASGQQQQGMGAGTGALLGGVAGYMLGRAASRPAAMPAAPPVVHHTVIERKTVIVQQRPVIRTSPQYSRPSFSSRGGRR